MSQVADRISIHLGSPTSREEGHQVQRERKQRVPALYVFEKEQFSSGLQNPMQFRQDLFWTGHRAQGARCHDCVKAVVGKTQRGGVALREANWASARLGAGCRATKHLVAKVNANNTQA
jgi:hypothetical protein